MYKRQEQYDQKISQDQEVCNQQALEKQRLEGGKNVLVSKTDGISSKEEPVSYTHLNDGFKIASEDLKLRGPGDMFGIRQSGSMIFKIGDVFADSACLVEAGKAADHILSEDPELKSEKYALSLIHI